MAACIDLLNYMNRSTLPKITVILVVMTLLITSCSKPGTEAAATNDSTASAADSTGEEGHPDGDIIVSPEFIKQRREEDSLAQIGQQDDDEDRELGPYEDEPMTSIQQAELDVCGFSSDRKYFAFTQWTAGDMIGGEGQVVVIDVARNQWASKPAILLVDDELDPEEIPKVLAAKRDSMIRKFDIPYHKSQFKIYDLIAGPPVVDINGQKYDILFTNTDGRFDVRVKGNGKEITLQKDSKVPASRGVVRRARLGSAYVSGEQIVVFVEYDGDVQTGFENYRYYDRKNIAITGTIR